MTAWKDLERRICVALGGRRAGPLGAAVSDCVNVPFAVEVKRSSKPGPPVNAAWIAQSKAQAEREGKKRRWIVVVAGHNARRLTVTLDFGLFLQIAQRAGVIPVTPEAARFIAGLIPGEQSVNSPQPGEDQSPHPPPQATHPPKHKPQQTPSHNSPTAHPTASTAAHKDSQNAPSPPA